MSDPVIIKAQPGQSVGDAVKQNIQQAAQAKQLISIKKDATAKICNVINVIMQTWAIDPDNAFTTAITYAAGLAIGSGTKKEDALAGFEKIWATQLAQAEEVKKEQLKMVSKILNELMEQKKPIEPQLISNIEALGGQISDDVRKYVDAHSTSAAH